MSHKPDKLRFVFSQCYVKNLKADKFYITRKINIRPQLSKIDSFDQINYGIFLPQAHMNEKASVLFILFCCYMISKLGTGNHNSNTRHVFWISPYKCPKNGRFLDIKWKQLISDVWLVVCSGWHCIRYEAKSSYEK